MNVLRMTTLRAKGPGPRKPWQWALASICALGVLLAFGRPGFAELLSAWVQYAAHGTVAARAVTDDLACPAITVDGRTAAMGQRAAPNEAFPVRICETALPANAAAATIGGLALPLPARAPQRILVVGDTGCRVKVMIVPLVQDCDDPAAWPWRSLAQAAAALNPDLVIHLGDYYYREDACPPGFAGCAKSPHGDSWPTWDADFFAPARPLLAAAPFVLVRGNHEDCRRGGAGWTRLLDPGPFDPAVPCVEHDPLYVATAGALAIAVLDSAIAPDPSADPRLVPLYASEFAALRGLPGPAWLVMHRPLYGVVRLVDGHVEGGNATLVAGLGDELPAGVELLLAGHIHVLQVSNFAGGGPPQLIAGASGDVLDKQAPPDLAGMVVGGRRITDGFSLGGFGFAMMERTGLAWRASIYDAAGKLLRRCNLEARRLDCAGR